MSDFEKINNLLKEVSELIGDDSKGAKKKIANNMKIISSLAHTIYLVYSQRNSK